MTDQPAARDKHDKLIDALDSLQQFLRVQGRLEYSLTVRDARNALATAPVPERGVSDARIEEIAYFGSYVESDTRYWTHEGVQKAIRQALAESGISTAPAAK